jgi:V/A-type H+-transporting ATPase subunit I
MLLSMAKVQIIGTKPCQDKTVQLLHLLGMVQIDAWDEGRSLSQKRMTLSDEAIHLRERLAYLATHVEAVLAALPPLEVTPPTAYEEFYAHPLELLLYVVESELEEVGPEVRALVARRDQLEEQLGSLPRYEATLRQLLPLMPAIIDLEHFAVTAVWVERRYQAALDTTIRQLNELTEGLCEAMSREVDEDTLVAVLVFPKTEVEAVNKWLDQESITQIRLPTEFSGQPLEKALTNIRWRLEAIPRELAEGEATLETLAENWRPRLSNWLALLRDHQAQIDVRSHFGQTDHTFIIEGWVPRRRLGEMEAALASEVGNEVLVTELPLSAEEQKLAPVMFDNPALVRPFEPLVGLLALPQYGDFDPTPLMFLFFPLFFGLILGDVAYGAILLILMIYLRQRFQARPALRSLAEVMIMGAVWSIVFGFLYGELFGTLGELLGLHPLWFDRGHNVQALFLLTVGIGAGHIVLGLCLGLWLALRRHSHHEVIEKTATLVSLAALFLLVAVLSDYLPASFLTPIIALLVVGLAVLIYSLGGIGIILGPLELLGTVGNILSYLRIAAIGLSSIYLAQVANELAGVAGNLLLGLIIAGLFHALNIVLGTFSPTIQSLRLHYVEFFGKFYEGGGRPFRPFQRSIVQR